MTCSFAARPGKKSELGCTQMVSVSVGIIAQSLPSMMEAVTVAPVESIDPR